MRRLALFILSILACIVLAACGDDDKSSTEEQNESSSEQDSTEASAEDDSSDEKQDNLLYEVPEELMITEDIEALNPDMESADLEDQYGLSIGETGYAVAITHYGVLELTLNSVELTDEYKGEETNQYHDDATFVIADYTLRNLGVRSLSTQQFDYPVVADAAMADKLEKGDRLGRDELLGMGDSMSMLEGDMSTIPVEPGEEVDGIIKMYAEEQADRYMIFFGYQDYTNNVTWEFDADEAK